MRLGWPEAVAALGVIAVLVTGYAAGRAGAPDEAEAMAAQRASYAAALPAARSEARERARSEAFAGALRSAKRAGRTSGTRRGRRAGRVEAARLEAEATRKANEAAAAQRQRDATRRAAPCVDVGGGECLTLGPGAGGGSCPPGSVPNADGGVVCVPLRN